MVTGVGGHDSVVVEELLEVVEDEFPEVPEAPVAPNAGSEAPKATASTEAATPLAIRWNKGTC